MQGIAMQKLSVRIDRSLDGDALDDTLASAANMLFCEEGLRGDASVLNKRRLLILQKPVPGVRHHIRYRRAKYRQVCSVLNGPTAASVLVHGSLQEISVGVEYPARLQRTHRRIHLEVDGVAYEAERKGDFLRSARSPCCDNRVRRLESVERESNRTSETEKHSLAGEALLIVVSRSVVRT